MNLDNFRETYDYQTLELTESKKKGVLGVLKGPSFFEDRPSRNKRSYKDCWKPALSRAGTKRILEDGLMFGTVGHMDTDLDGLVREGKVSHRTSKLKMQDNGVGYGEFELLDTALGRFIHTAAKSGSKFAVSSKAMGESKGKDGDGNDKVEPSSFKLERFDIVIDPGFLDAKPELREQLNEAVKEEVLKKPLVELNINDTSVIEYKKEVGMDTNLLEKALEEKIDIEKELGSALKDLSTAESKITLLETAQKDNKSLTGNVELLTDQMKEYRDFFDLIGKPEDIQEALKSAKDIVTAYTDIGSISEVLSKITEAEDLIEDIDDMGTVDTIRRGLTRAKEIGEKLEVHGGFDVIESALDGAFTYIKQIHKDTTSEDVQDLSSKYGVVEDKVQAMVEKIGTEQTEAILEDLKTSGALDARTIPEKDPDTTLGKGRLGRMMETLGGKKSDDN